MRLVGSLVLLAAAVPPLASLGSRASQEDNRLEVIRQVASFAGVFSRSPVVHIHSNELLRNHGLRLEGLTGPTLTVGLRDEVVSCVEKAGADPCSWSGPGNGGGAVLEITQLTFDDPNHPRRAEVEAMVVLVPETMGRVEAYSWRFRFRYTGSTLGWQLQEAKMVSET